jgi:hypothetical protein
MNRPDPDPLVLSPTTAASVAFDPSTPLKAGPRSTGRLIVLVPPDSDYEAATQRIWQIATAADRHVQFLGLCQDRSKELSLRRQLITMSALVNDRRISAEVKVDAGTSWVDAVRKIYQTGDVIVCFAEQRAGILHRPLNQILEEHLDAPVLILWGFSPLRPPGLSQLSSLFMWAGFLSIIAVAFLLQARMTALPQDWVQTTLLILSVIGEFWLLRAWNNVFH